LNAGPGLNAKCSEPVSHADARNSHMQTSKGPRLGLPQGHPPLAPKGPGVDPRIGRRRARGRRVLVGGYRIGDVHFSAGRARIGSLQRYGRRGDGRRGDGRHRKSRDARDCPHRTGRPHALREHDRARREDRVHRIVRFDLAAAHSARRRVPEARVRPCRHNLHGSPSGRDDSGHL